MFTITKQYFTTTGPVFDIQGGNGSWAHRLYLRGVSTFLKVEADLGRSLPLNALESRIKELTQ